MNLDLVSTLKEIRLTNFVLPCAYNPLVWKMLKDDNVSFSFLELS